MALVEFSEEVLQMSFTGEPFHINKPLSEALLMSIDIDHHLILCRHVGLDPKALLDIRHQLVSGFSTTRIAVVEVLGLEVVTISIDKYKNKLIASLSSSQ